MPGKSSGGVVGYRYYLGMHLASCKGLDRLLSIVVENRRLFGDGPATKGMYDPTLTGTVPTDAIEEGNQWVISTAGTVDGTPVAVGDIIVDESDPVTQDLVRSVRPRQAVSTSQDIQIDKEDLFGGEEREGGFSGVMGIQFGLSDQMPDPYLVQQFGAEFTPGFRGLFTKILKQMYIGVLPRLKNIGDIGERIPCAAWYPEKAKILCQDGYFDANPAHIIRELLVSDVGSDVVWGLGYSPSIVNDTNFRSVADALYAEGFGLSFLWDAQSTIEEFIKDILNHINGVLRINNQGLFELKLIRADYSVYSLLELNEDNCELIEYESLGWGETVNEVVVRYTQRWTGKSESVVLQDIANIQIQGQVISQAFDYPGIQDGDLAYRIGQMQLQVLSTPLTPVTLKVNRSAYNLFEGDVFTLVWPDKGLNSAVFRVTEVDRGTVNDNVITLKAVLDVFGLPAASFMQNERPVVTSQNKSARKTTVHKVTEASFWDLVYGYGYDYAATQPSGASYLLAMAKQPESDTNRFDLYANPGITGDVTADYEFFKKGHFCPCAKLGVPLSKAIESTVTYTDGQQMSSVAAKWFGYIGDEIVSVESIDQANNTMVINRGVFDTVPEAHIVGEDIFFYGSREQGTWSPKKLAALSTTELVADASPYYSRICPVSSIDRIKVANAVGIPTVLTGRSLRPYPVGNFRIGGLRYPYSVPAAGDLNISFCHRDRLQQTAYIVLQDATNIGPEDNVVYTLSISYPGAGVVRTVTIAPVDYSTYLVGSELVFVYTQAMQATDLSAHIPGYVTDMALPEPLTVTVLSTRDSLDNHQSQSCTFYRFAGTGGVTMDNGIITVDNGIITVDSN